MAFDQQALITTEFEHDGRFGTTLSKLGDINLDGYNDIAVSAPFEDNGAVYIYLGGPDGLSTKHSQRIQAPSELPSPYEDVKSSMFGHGISRGVDIDSNGYHDIAIGSPNSEAVYIFKSYPVVKFIASITPSKSELSLEDTRFELKICAKLETMTHIENEIGKIHRLTHHSFTYDSLLQNSPSQYHSICNTIEHRLCLVKSRRFTMIKSN